MEYEWWKSSRILEDAVIKCILRESNEKRFSVWSTSSFSLTLWRVSTVVVVDQCTSAIKTHWNNYMARLEPCHCCPDCNYNYCYWTETTAVEPTHLDYLIDEAHMSDRVSLLHQNLLQMLHLKNMQQRNLHTIFISLADRAELRFWCVNEQSVMAGQSVGTPVYTQHISGPSVSPGWSTEQREKLQCCLVSVALLCPVHLGEDVN